MRVYVVCPLFPPEPIVSSQTTADIATGLAERGHDVIVFTGFPNRPAGQLYPGYRRRLLARQRLPNGVQVVRCFATLSPESRMISRFLENVTFGLTTAWALLRSPRPDVIYANTWPIFAAGLMALVARLWRVPLVTIVQDVYPESLVSQQRLRADSVPARLMRRIDRSIARSSRQVIALSTFFLDLYRTDRQVPTDRLHLVRNWIDGQRVRPDDQRAAEVRERLGIPHDAVVMAYGGNIGVAAGVETVIESFRNLIDIPNLYLLIAGEGSRLAACQQLADTIGNPHVRFYVPWPEAETSMLLASANLMILPTRGRQSQASVPSKLIAYMLAARPVLALSLPHTDLADVIEQSDCGWLIEPDQPAQLAAKIRDIVSHTASQWQWRGQSGRAFALKHLTRESCLPRIIEIVESAAVHRS
jgi:colanic acid biosynthesis glycosyl transferase WcaI